MKTKYAAPIAEKLEFDYTNVVVASNGHGDVGHGVSTTDKGCDGEHGHNNPNPNGNGPRP